MGKDTYLDEPLMMLVGSTKYYYHANDLYSVAALTNSSGTVLERYKYDPYGKVSVLDASGAVKADPNNSEYGNPFTYTGLYAYTSSKPTRFLDPLGLYDDDPEPRPPTHFDDVGAYDSQRDDDYEKAHREWEKRQELRKKLDEIQARLDDLYKKMLEMDWEIDPAFTNCLGYAMDVGGGVYTLREGLRESGNACIRVEIQIQS